MYERRILVLFSKATFSIYYVYMCTCIHVFMNTRFSLFQQNYGCEAVCFIRRIFVDSAQVVGLDLALIYTSLDECLGYVLGTPLTQILVAGLSASSTIGCTGYLNLQILLLGHLRNVIEVHEL